MVEAVSQPQTLCEYYSQWDEYDDTIFYDEFDAAFVGFGWQFNVGPVSIYREDLVLQILMDGGASEEDALEHDNFNVTGAYVGERTPIFLTHDDDEGMQELRKRRAGERPDSWSVVGAELSGWGESSGEIEWE